VVEAVVKNKTKQLGGRRQRGFAPTHNEHFNALANREDGNSLALTARSTLKSSEQGCESKKIQKLARSSPVADVLDRKQLPQ